MAKQFSVQTALQLIFEETEGFDGDAEEIVSESEDNISEFEEEDEHQPAPKRKRASGLALQQAGPSRKQPAPGPTREQPDVGPARQPKRNAVKCVDP